MIRLCSSARICLRPLFILSASAMSSGDSRSLTTPATMLSLFLLVVLLFEISNRARFERQIRQQLFQLIVVLLGVHAVFAQAELSDLPLQRIALLQQCP